ncbi:MAG: FadR/GntR family transcriptional regulator [Clostridia bacterium]|nr:FadR/GntR family transcriptional regulator [Clostridia bacterium]
MFTNYNKTLPEQTADKIIQYIIENNLQVDDKIPNEFELGEILDVGRSTVREAVRILVTRNILVIRRGAGTYVANNTGVSDDPLGLAFAKDKYKLANDLLHVRIILEPEIAAMAANMANERDIEVITKQCDKVEALIKQGENHMLEDVKFHEAIARCTGNDVIEKLIPIINTSVAVFANITDRQLREETITTHRAIANAIAKHNSTDAKHAMTMHMLYNKYKIYELIDKKENSN